MVLPPNDSHFRFHWGVAQQRQLTQSKNNNLRTSFGYARGYPMLSGYSNMGLLEPTNVSEDILL